MKKINQINIRAMKKLYFLLTIIVFSLVLMPSNVVAGWVITGRFIDTEGNTVLKKYYIEGADIKVERYNLIYSFNTENEQIIIVDPENLLFVKTDFISYSAKLKEIKLRNLSELLSIVPQNQKDSLASAYKALINERFKLNRSPIDGLTIGLISDSLKFLGYPCSKYTISVNGLRKEELVFTQQINVFDESDFHKFLEFVFLIEPEDETVRYQTTEIFSQTFGSGTVLRRFMFNGGYRTEWQVNLIEKKKIPFYEFTTPDLCKELTLDKWLARKQSALEIQYDDYE